MPEFSQRTLGLVRAALERIRPPSSYTDDHINFWRDALFDAGFPQGFIDVAQTYGFSWGRIIPDLFTNRFANHNSYFDIPRQFDTDALLRRLTHFAVNHTDDDSKRTITESLSQDGFPVMSSDTKVPAELAQLPRREEAIRELQSILNRGELVAALFIDLDGFKSVNDQKGHPEGDQCLVTVARIMARAVLQKGKLYRYGGDEFVVLLANFDLQEAAATAERIRSSIDAENPGGNLKVTASIGVAGSQGIHDSAALIEEADKAMYRAKRRKNSVVVS